MPLALKPSAMLPCALACLALASSASLLAQFQPVVSYSQVSLGANTGASPVVTDACGDVYMYKNNAIVEIQAGTGTEIVIEPDTQGYNSTVALYMDAGKKNLYFPDPTNYYTTHFDQLPIVNCAPGYLNNGFAGNLYDLPNPNYYWGTASDIAGDANGDVFFTTSSNVTTAIYLETYNATANTYTPSQILTWKNNISFIVADAAGNVYFNDGTTNIYQLKAAGNYGAVPTTPFASGFQKITGLSIDPQGDLFVSDGTANLVYEIPLEAAGLNPADKFAVASIGVPYKVAVDAEHNIYLNDYSGPFKLLSGSAVATNTTYGSSSSFSVNYVFNAATTPTGIAVDSGTAASSAFTATSGGCAANTAYAVGGSCSVNLSYTPNAVGLQTGAVVLSSGSSVLNVAQVSGTGLGAAITIDPGSVTSLATSLVTPTGVAVDNVGNVFVTDQETNKLYEFVGGTGAPTAVGTGTLTLSTPTGVAVDNQGDIFIADTGNSRIVEIPSINGVLTNASTAALALTSAAKSPQGVAVDAQGSLYIADTGNNRLLYIPTINGALSVAATQTFTGLNAPSAVTIDPIGNVYVAETGSNDVLEYTTPIGNAAALKVAASLSTPTALATDASASLFVADSGSGNIYRYPNVGGNLGTRTLVGSTVASPVGVAVDKSGNLYVTDSVDSVVDQIARVQTSLLFGTWNVNAASNPYTESILSSGNASVVFQTPSYTPSGATTAGFAVTNDGCAGQTVLAGGTCSITATFTPPVLEANAQETLTFASNASNGTPKLVLTGTGASITASTVSLVLTSPTGTLHVGVAASFTATIGTGTNNASPAGTVDFYVNGSLVGAVKVASGKAVLNLPSLTAGALTITAVYSGDQINYSGSEATINETVLALPDSLVLTATTPYTNPQSVTDSYANAKGPNVPLIATLTLSSTTIPGGTVTFYSGTTALGTVSVVPASGGLYTATLNTTALRAGTANVVEGGGYLTTYNLSATYSGDSTYDPATSNSLPIVVVGPPTTPPACATAATPTCYSSPTGATFTLSPNPLAITITSTGVQGQALGSAILTGTSYGGWTGYLDFTCSGLPAYTTCNPYPGTPQITASTPGAPQALTSIQFFINSNVTPIVPTGSSIPWWISGLFGFVLLALRRKVRRLGFNRLCTLAAIALLMVSSVAGMSGCSTGVTTFVTPAGTSNITVTVHASQAVPGSTNQASYLNDYNAPTFHITLTVK